MAHDDYTAGYGKPPKHSQFKKGESGFKGRKHKQKLSPTELFDRILNELVTISEGGKTAKMTKLEVFLRQMTAAALSGDRHARKLVHDYVYRRQSERAAQGDSSTDDFLIQQLTNLLAVDRPERECNGEA